MPNSNANAKTTRRYERTKLTVGILNLATYIAVPAAVLLTGASADLRDFIADYTGGIVVLGAVVYVVAASITLELLTLPLGYFSGHVVEHRYGLSRRTIRGWLGDWLKGLGLQSALMIWL